MKNHLKTLVFILPLFLSVNSFSQGDLQFNRVVLETFGLYSICGNCIEIDTLVVPAGKVLKINRCSLKKISGSEFENANVEVYIAQYKIFGGGTTLDDKNPFWLPAGSHKISIINRYGSSSSTYTENNVSFSFSGIEFNVVP